MSDVTLETLDKDLAQLNVITLADPSEDSIALAFVDKHGDKLRYDHSIGKWYRWDGIRWKQENTSLAFSWARDLCREINRHHKNVNVPKVRTAAAVEKFAQVDRRVAVEQSVWDQRTWLLCTPDGTVDLKTGNIEPNTPKNLITKCTSVSPKIMPTPIWHKFLEQATRNDDDLIRFLQQIAGYCLTGITREHALFFLYGLGGNGKGVYENCKIEIMGDFALAAPMDTFTVSKYDSHPTELARMAGARLVAASETEEGRAWAESRIKQLTGGDTITARFMRKDFFEYVPQFKLIFQGNHKPILNNVDDAARRRFNIIPFTFKPAQPDQELPEKLKPEYPGILKWMIDGCLDWQKNGLVRPEVVIQETKNYFNDQDIFSHWLGECTEEKTQNTGETSARLFNSWSEWTKRQGENPGNSKSFKERMQSAGHQHVIHTPGNHGKRGFVGIALKVEDTSHAPYAD